MTTETEKPLPSFAERLLAVLPDHVHINSALFSWDATWTTPRGVWKVSRSNAILSTGTQITGPNIWVRLGNTNANTVIRVLELHGAIEATPTATPLAKEPTRGIGGKPSDESTLLDEAWGVIACAGLHKGGWEAQHPEWVAGAIRWRDRFHAWLSRTPLAEYDEAVRLAEANKEGAAEPVVVAEDAEPGRPACETAAGCDGNDCVGPTCDKQEAPACRGMVNGKPCRKRAEHRGSCQPKLAQGGIVIPPPDGSVNAAIVIHDPAPPTSGAFGVAEYRRHIQGGGMRA